MKLRKKFMKGLSSISLAGLVMSNMSYVHADETVQPLPTVNQGDQSSESGHKGITVSNFNNPNSPSLTQDNIDALKDKNKKVLDAENKAAQASKFSTKKSLSSLDTNRPDDVVNVIVQLKGQTAPEMAAASAGNLGVSTMSINAAVSSIKKDIQDTKNQIMSTLSVGTSKSEASKGFHFKQEYENVFKGFSIDNIKYSDINEIKSLPNVKAVTLQQTFSPAVNQQHDLTGIKNLWSGAAVGKPTGYHGEGMLIAIVDTGIDYTHEAFPDPKDMSKARIKTGKYKRTDGSISLKVVDGYNWADQNDDIIPRVEDPNNQTSSHGVHVAGIAAGSGPVIQGVAPEAQLIAEKVFSDHSAGAMTEDIVKGIDHASALGADVINMSLGSSSSFDTRDPNDPLGISIRNATDEGHVVVVAAGNASNAYSDRNGGMGQSIKIGQEPDLNKIGNPGVYPDSFTVAAANNIVHDHIYSFYSSYVGQAVTGHGLDDWNWPANKDKQYQLMRLGKNGKGADGNDAIGQPSDYKGINVTGKIVLVKRGTLNFADKVANAAAAGAAGIIVYNSDPNKPAPDPLGFASIPFSFISYQDGMVLQNALDVKECGGVGKCGVGIGIGGGGGIGPLSISPQAAFVPGTLTFKIQDEKQGSAWPESNPGEPTDFTSWGTTSDLLLKPEVMAPGQAIVSSVRTADTTKHNAYVSEDGTSMATPYVVGAVADVMQALEDKGYAPGTRAFAQLTKNLIMNTSIPTKRDYVNANNPETRSDYMTEYQPRRQGAGMIRPDLAVKTPVVVSASNGTGSVSLKEIGDTSTFVLSAQNLTDQSVTYKLNGTVMTDVLKDALKANSDNIRSQYLKDASLSYDNNQLTIPANSIKRVTVTLKLPDSLVKNQFVEGYIYFTPTDSTLPTLNVPYNGFYGKWDEPKIIDTPDTTNVWSNSGVGTQLLLDAGGFVFGYKDLFGTPTTPAEIADGDKFYSFNPMNGMIPLPALALLRNARDLKIDVVDKDHNLVSHLSDDQWVTKTDPYSGGIPVKYTANWIWNAWNQAVPVPDGQYYFAITATADAPNAKPQPTYYMPMYLDTTAPTMNVLRSAAYDEKTHPETTSTGSYTVKWTMNDGDAAKTGGDVYLAINGQEPYYNYQQTVTQNPDGTYQLPVSGLNEGLNIITVAPVDRAGNMGEDHNIIVNKTSNDLWIDGSTATLNDNVPSWYWEANEKPGDTFSLNFKGIGRTNSLKRVQAVILKNNADKTSIVGSPVDLDLTQAVTQKPYYGPYSEYSINGQFTVPSTLPSGKYYVMYYCLADGENWTDANAPVIGIETYVDDVAPTITLSPSRMKAYVENPGDPVSFMLYSFVRDTIGDSHGYNVQYSLDGAAPVSMGSITNYSDTGSNQPIRYPVVLSNGDHSITIQATDGTGNTSTSSFNVTVTSTNVKATVGTSTYQIPVNVVPYKDTTKTADIHMTDPLMNGVYTAEHFDPRVNGWLVSPFGNDGSYSGNPDLYPILLVGNQQRRATIVYDGQANMSFTSNPADVYEFQNQQVGYNDPSSIPTGDSTFPVTMVDYLGHVKTINLPVHKNPIIPTVKFDNTVIDHDNMDTATFYTYDSTYNVTGSVTAVNDKFFAEMEDYNQHDGKFHFKNLFDSNSVDRNSEVDDNKTLSIPAGYVNDPGVKKFSFNSGQLHPGPNYFSIQGGSVTGGNPAYALAGIHPLVYNVVIYQLGTAEGADQTLATQGVNNLTFASFNGENKHQSLLETNVDLPLVDNATHAQISWSSSNPDVITNDGLVIRPDDDTAVTLTATATVGTATAVKTFNVTVAGKQPMDEVATAEDASYITWDVIRSDNTDQSNVTNALSLPTRGSNGSRIEWTSDDPAHITNEGRVYKPLFDEGDAHVELVAKVTRNGSTEYKTFNLTVLKDGTNKERTIVLRAYQSFDQNSVLGDNPDLLDVTHNLSLPTTYGNDGVKITWLSNNPDIIANDGTIVALPAVNQYITLDAIFQLGSAHLTQEYGFFVRSQDTTNAGNQAAVTGAKASIVWNLLKKDNVDQNAVKSDLNLPTNGTNGTTITWSSSNPSIISPDGKVNLPTYEAGNQTITLTATITKGNYSDTKQYNVTVLHDTDKTAPVVSGIDNNGLYNKDVTISYNEGKAALDGQDFASGTIVTKDGNHTLVVTDEAGNVTTVNFTIDKTAPVVTGVSNKSLYNKDVTVKFNEGTATLNGKAFASGTAVKTNGSYTLIVKDAAGNVTTVKFTIDKTAPKAPAVNKVTSATTKVTGTAEAGSTIVIKAGTKIIGTATADKYGKFTISIAKQKAGTILYVTAKDKAGNVSRATKITVSK